MRNPKPQRRGRQSMHLLVGIALALLTVSGLVQAADEGKHLFILSGQSNMAGMNPKHTFTPAVEKAFGRDAVLVVKDARGGSPIGMWVVTDGEGVGSPGRFYGNLLDKALAAKDGQVILSTTFVWMQGEADASAPRGKKKKDYASDLKALMAMLKRDLGIEEMYFVLGRLSDHEDEALPLWDTIREIQVRVAEEDPRGAWIDTDDLNDGVNRKGVMLENDLHYSVEGYRVLGQRFAEAAIVLIDD